MTDPILRLTDVVKSYDGKTRALDEISLSVNRSEVISIIGPSGCGKSTLLRTVNGLEPIQGGSIRFHDRAVAAPGTKDAAGTKWQQVRQQIGMVFQSYELFPHLDVIDNLLLGPKVVQKADLSEARERGLALLRRVGLEDRADAFPRQLSGGQKQRVAIVRALMMQPEIMLLDEITASLDPEMVREVLDVVLELARDGMTMLIVTHEMAFARAISDRVVFMDAGRIVETGPAEPFFEHPRTERARRFLNTFEFEAPEKD
ncbi:amino acid ABC transporter ATP-binding protein [Gulosibacter sp. 10]|uniref:amino acid ABC transporter ATP-binding protein n=1 Tax=Gulosibacter sp. 10 TaxID=1255570 RepID=UPI00097F56F4|nr:amino acid ABC transporter ATP-binding protein [Gulosibacter sp. 10]SJM70167.1 Amino-acid ABC transporter ATP-binding protein [Gulosibacter sp. 10]